MVISSFTSIIQRSIFAESRNNRPIFARDILLSREVAREIKLKKKISPWIDMGNYFKGAAWVMGNFEANVGNSADCVDKSSSLCFAVAAENLNYLKKAGFSAVGVENNHSGDLEKWGRENTIKSLRNARIQPLNFMNSTGFLRLGEYTVAFVTLSNVAGQDGKSIAIPSLALRQKIRLARSLADFVVVFVHWGAELADWVQPNQRQIQTVVYPWNGFGLSGFNCFFKA